MKRCSENKNNNMNIKSLLLGTIIATLAGSTFATDALLSPRAQGNQIKVVPVGDAPTVTVSYVDAVTPLIPRLQANQAKVVKGVVTDHNAALNCLLTMNGTPKAVTACSQSTTMPGCK